MRLAENKRAIAYKNTDLFLEETEAKIECLTVAESKERWLSQMDI